MIPPLATIEYQLSPVKEVAIVGEDTKELERTLWEKYLPNKVVAIARDANAADIPLLEGRSTVDGKPAAYVCENFVCSRPVTTPAELTAQLDEQ